MYGGFLYISFQILLLPGLYVHQWNVQLKDLALILYVSALQLAIFLRSKLVEIDSLRISEFKTSFSCVVGGYHDNSFGRL